MTNSVTNIVLKMQDAGFSNDQVEAITEYIDSGAATKEDIAGLRGDTNTWFEKLEGKIDAQGERLEGKIIGLDGKIIGLEGKMNTKFEKMAGKINIVYWMLALIIAVQVAPYLKTLFG